MNLFRLGVCDSKAARRYQRRALVATLFYVVAVFGCEWLSQHAHVSGWELYALAMLPAVPVLMVVVAMARYLREETDEYLRWQMVRSLLTGTAALLSVVVVNDFLRLLAHVGALPPIVCFVVFVAGFAIAQGVQKLRNRPADE